MKILVTGGTGFIGAYMANHLNENGHEVTICDNNFRGKVDDFIAGLHRIEIDMTIKEEYNKLDTDYDCVYHFAAINGTDNFYKIPHLVLKVNTLININFLDWCVTNGIKKILSTSSSEVYACTVSKQIPTNEDVVLSIDDINNPRYSYAGSKIFGELLFFNYHSQYDLDVRVVRPHNIYGPRMGFNHVIPQVIDRINDNENPFKLYGFDQTRSFCYILDAIDAFELIMNSENCSGKILHLGTNVETKIEDLVKNLFNISNYHPEVELTEAPPGSVDRRCPDITLLTTLTGYKPRFDLDYGLNQCWNWFLDNNSLSKKS